MSVALKGRHFLVTPFQGYRLRQPYPGLRPGLSNLTPLGSGERADSIVVYNDQPWKRAELPKPFKGTRNFMQFFYNEALARASPAGPASGVR